ncbi:MAG: 23S rRNA (guanosine(2251)-2'-O)-methyltransferase RlmB [Chloroflexi bacterium]|nr:23S rRNA (guanosine(2251)-2'-O)-methyltransferase RlmB [Chloroflexota bacterium]
MDHLYGRNSVFEALRAARRPVQRVLVARGAHGIEDLVTEARLRRVPVDSVDRYRLDRLGGAHHQGVVAEAAAFPYAHLDSLPPAGDSPLLLVLDSLQDPQNFGTLLRTAQATGVDGVLIPEHRAVGVTPAVSNASAGAVEHLRIVRVTNLARTLQQLKATGVWTFGLAVDAEQAYWAADLSGPIAIVVGSEGSGLSRLVRETCDILVAIPMAGGSVQSLNASVAGSLVLYEGFRQRGATLRQP